MLWAAGFTIVMTLMSVFDIRKREVPLWSLLLCGLLAAGRLVFRFLACGSFREILWTGIGGMLPGMLLLGLALLSGKAGMADGIVLLCAAAGEGYFFGMTQLLTALLLLAPVSGVLLALKKVRKNDRMPFLPFLTAGYLVAFYWLGR